MSEKENELKYEAEYEGVEPPELEEAGVPPLKKQISWFAIGVGVALIIVLAFSVYFYLQNQR